MAYKDINDIRKKQSRDKWYKENKQKQIDRQKIRKEYNKLFIKRWKNTQKCRDCGISFKNRTYLCDLHHLKDKKDNVGKLINHSLKMIKDEIRKCIPLCANCHRERHSLDLYN